MPYGPIFTFLVPWCSGCCGGAAGGGTVAATATTFTDNNTVDAAATSYEHQLDLANGCTTPVLNTLAQAICLTASSLKNWFEAINPDHGLARISADFTDFVDGLDDMQRTAHWGGSFLYVA